MLPPPDTRAELLVITIPFALAAVALVCWAANRDQAGLQQLPAATAAERPAPPRAMPTRFPGP